jgi:hypothetical protein
MPATYDDPDFRAAERVVRRRRLVAAAVVLLAFLGVAGGSAAAAFASAHDDRADAQVPAFALPSTEAGR